MNKGVYLAISKQDLTDALTFYNIKDKWYINKCYECLENILQNPNTIYKFNEAYKILFLDNLDRCHIKEMWKKLSIEELFGEGCLPFITNVLLLSGYTIHIKNISKYSLNNTQISLHIKRVNETLTNDIYLRNYPGIRIIKMIWGAFFINMKIIEIGILQYELCYHNPINTHLQESCIKIHIPEGNRLYINDVKKSINDSKVYIKQYFKLEQSNYYCISWLLSPEIHKVIDNNSNIYNFYTLFNVTTSNSTANEDILEFVFKFQNCDNYATLPENTSLQKILKEMLLKDIPLHVGIGLLK